MNSRFDPKQADARRPNQAASPVEQPLSATEARQGRKGTPVLMVLISALILLAVAWGVAEWWGEATDPPAQQTASPPAGDNTPANSNATPSANPAAAPPAAAPASGSQPAKP
jgi:hypothetical protein